MKVYGADESAPEEEPDDPNIPNKATVGNRKNRRRHGVRSSYAEKLKELQKGRDRGDRT